MDAYQHQKSDLVTNVFPRSFPKGQSVEVFSRNLLKKSLPLFDEKADFEHVTHFFYKNKEKYIISNFKNDIDYSENSLAVDTSKDFQAFCQILNKAGRKIHTLTLDELIKLKDHYN